jgi:rhamnosyltransferase subunit B
MSRFVLATFGSLGDLHPYIAVGLALKAQGHEAVVATSPDYAEAVAAAGLGFEAVGPAIESFGDRTSLSRRLFHPIRGPELLIREIVMPHLRQAQADITRAASGADLLVSHPLTFTVPLVAHSLGLPWVSTVLAPMSLMSRHDPPHLGGVNILRIAHRLGPTVYDLMLGVIRAAARRWEAPLHAYRRELGMPPSTQVMLFEGQFSPQGNLALFDAQLAMPQADWPGNTQVCGMPMYDGAAEDRALREDLHRFLSEGEAPIVFALGSSAVWIAGDFWRRAIDAAVSLGRRAILLSGPATLPPLPPGIRAYGYLPYSAVFPHAAAIVHQAGIGTLAQALRSGRPQLITPVAFDQPDNAARAAKLGLARVLPFQSVTASRLQAQLSALLANPAYADAARRVAQELSAVDGAERAARGLIELQRRRPASGA